MHVLTNSKVGLQTFRFILTFRLIDLQSQEWDKQQNGPKSSRNLTNSGMVANIFKYIYILLNSLTSQ